VRLFTGGRVVFTVRDTAILDAQPENTELGPVLVATPEQTLIDLIRRPSLGGLTAEAAAATRALRDQVDNARLTRLLERAPTAVRRRVETTMVDD
jgi:predicted transcriptional regulator of viral defense system